MTTEAAVVASVIVDSRELHVVAYAMHEALNDVSYVSCEVVFKDETAPSPAQLHGLEAEFRLVRSDGKTRQFFGVITHAVRGQSEDDVITVKLGISPSLWRLGKRSDGRVFQQMSVIEIVKKVCLDAGMSAEHLNWQCSESYPKRPTTTQYCETDLDFVLRLLAEEGIAVAIEHSGHDKLHFFDAPTGLGSIDAPNALGFVQRSGFQVASDHIFDVDRRTRVVTAKVSLRDYDHRKPDRPPEASASVKLPAQGEIYHYADRFTEDGRAKHLSSVWLDSIACTSDVITGETGSVHFAPGHTFSIENHPLVAMNGEYFITEVRFEGEERRHGSLGVGDFFYTCFFTAIPAKQRYRPPMRARARHVRGPQTGVTTGAAGSEISLDEYGAVTTHFFWDRTGKTDEHASQPMRTLQPALSGGLFSPRVGWEVGTQFYDGDIDRPFVTTRMISASKPASYKLPDHKTTTTIQTLTSPGGGLSNEVRFVNTTGSEQIYFHASRDLSIDIGNDRTISIGQNLKKTVDKNLTTEITNSLQRQNTGNRERTVKGKQNVTIETVLIDEIKDDGELTIDGRRIATIGGDHRVTVKQDNTETVSMIQMDAVLGPVSYKTLANFNETIGKLHAVATNKNHEVVTGGSRSETNKLLKVIGTNGTRKVTAKKLDMTVLGLQGYVLSTDHTEKTEKMFTEIAAGAHITKAANVSYEAETILSFVMGASTITLLPGIIAVAGLSIKLDGELLDMGVLVMDN